MSTISSMPSRPPIVSMQERLQQELQSEVSSGTVSTSDADSISDALDAIDESMRADAQSSDAGSTPKSPDEMRDKIQSLIDDQVEAGTLTSDQAETLSKLFESAAPQEGGAGGPPPPPADGAESSSSTGDASQALDDFLSALKTSQTSGSTYGSNGSTTSSASSLVLDMTA
ncbi:hypothetical protein J3S89_04180 [Pinisolibacter sp. B13]|nr:hypothetical protein [Pinisolibacter aquiterrae]